MTKNQKIKESLLKTKERRQKQDIKVFEVKLDHLSKSKIEKLNRAFLEAKWIYNYSLDQKDSFNLDYKIKEIPVKCFNPETQKCDLIEYRALNLGSQIKQFLFKQVQENILNLNKAKKKGLKVGKLKFKKEINRIHLTQFGTTYKFKDNYVFIQKLGKFKIIGLKQLDDCEIGCADLIRKPSGFYLKITTFKNKKNLIKNGKIGLDFGIKDSITTSNGEKYKFSVQLPDRVKKLQRGLSKKKKGSSNYKKNLTKLKKALEKTSNKKDDLANKFVSKLKKFEKVIIQDENIKGWQDGFFGKQVSTSILGRIKGRIKCLSTSIVVDKYLPTTQICPSCGTLNKIPLSQRLYSCGCGFEEDRDIKSAKTILCFGIAREPSSMLVEDLTSVIDKNYIYDKLNPLKQEAYEFIRR